MRRSIATLAILAGIGVTSTAALTGTASAASTWAGLRQCESGGNYAINTGNGFYGAYQFDQGTWSGLGYPGRPDQSSPATQDEAAAKLYAERGSAPWPVCGQGLQGGSTSSGAVPARASRSADRPALVVAVRPVHHDPAVALLQRNLNALSGRGLAVDGVQGPATWAARKDFANVFRDKAGRPMAQSQVPYAAALFASIKARG